MCFVESIQNDKDIWKKLLKHFQANQSIQLKDFPRLEVLISEIFILLKFYIIQHLILHYSKNVMREARNYLMTNSQEFGFKISIIGDGGVGKTSLIKKYTKGTFKRDYIKTIGAQFSRYDKELNGDVINLIFWDIAGQNDFNFLQPLFYKESKAGIIVCSLETNDLGNDSFIHIKNWNNNLKKYCGDVPVVLFANKVDLVETDNIDTVKIQELVKKFDFTGYYITSAKTGEGVIEAFNAIIEKLYFKYKQLFSQQ